MTYDDVTVHGTVAPGFEGVRDAYAAVLAEDSTEPGYTRRRYAFPSGAAPENERLVAAVARAVEAG
ncbi:hypothetical protein [Streptomyces sp. NPDC002346]